MDEDRYEMLVHIGRVQGKLTKNYLLQVSLSRG